MRNAKMTGTLEKGNANTLAKNFKEGEKQKKPRRENEATLECIPVDMVLKGTCRRGKLSMQLALGGMRVSMASLAKFDKMHQEELECRMCKVHSVHQLELKHILSSSLSLSIYCPPVGAKTKTLSTSWS